MSKFLHRTRRKQLIRQHKGERAGRIRDRIKAVLLYDKDYTYSDIAKILLLDDETVRRHIADYEQDEKLHTENGGSKSQLDEAQTE
jgi:predicted ArsR family transcriptional regulator